MNTTIDRPACISKNRFDTVAAPFLQQPGLPFADVLSAETLRRAFAENESLFGQNDDEVFTDRKTDRKFDFGLALGLAPPGQAGGCGRVPWGFLSIFTPAAFSLFFCVTNMS
jgi:hypothetical protein